MERLRRAAEARTRWLRALTSQLNDDRRVAGAWLVGSTGSGTQDVWGDIDLVVSVESPTCLPDPVEWVSALPASALMFTLEVPRNAPADGAYLGLCLGLAELPVWSDWYLWPAATAAVPAGATVVVERPAAPLRRSEESFMALLDRHRTSATTKADRDDPRFRLLAVMLGAKYLAHGDETRLDHMISLLGVKDGIGSTLDAPLRRTLLCVDQPALRPAAAAVSALLDLACEVNQSLGSPLPLSSA